MIYSNNDSNFVLGCILNNPTLLFSDKYKIEKGDFTPNILHKIIFISAYNIAITNVKEVDEISIVEWLKTHEKEFNIFNKNNGIEFVKMIKTLATDKTFDYYYGRVKLHSTLRDYQQAKFDISEIYYEGCDLSSWDSQLVIDYFEKKQIKIKKRHSIDNETESMIVGSNTKELLEIFEQTPMVGASMRSGMRNALYRGLGRGHLFIVGSPSSFGKTTMAISDAVLMGATKIWSNKRQCYIDNIFYGGKTAYIHTEQAMFKEVNPRFLATISEIPYHKILDGDLNEEEKDRVLQAGEILENSQIKLINYPNFTPTGLKNRIRELGLDGYEFCIFDYMWYNGYIGNDMKVQMGLSNVSETTALINLANTLKTEGEKYGIGIYTMTQLNESWKLKEFLDASCLYGSANVQSKADGALCYASPKKKELAMVQDLIDKYNKDNPSKDGKYITPNAVSYCFKTRWSRYGRDIKIYHYVDNSIGKIIDMFATDRDDNWLDIPKLYIKTGGKIIE